MNKFLSLSMAAAFAAALSVSLTGSVNAHSTYSAHTHAPSYGAPKKYKKPHRASGSSHEQWCYKRFRSYRAWDNSYQPYDGGRRQCRSPYS